jgi:hypothetical protein
MGEKDFVLGRQSENPHPSPLSEYREREKIQTVSK